MANNSGVPMKLELIRTEEGTLVVDGTNSRMRLLLHDFPASACAPLGVGAHQLAENDEGRVPLAGLPRPSFVGLRIRLVEEPRRSWLARLFGWGR